MDIVRAYLQFYKYKIDTSDYEVVLIRSLLLQDLQDRKFDLMLTDESLESDILA